MVRARKLYFLNYYPFKNLFLYIKMWINNNKIAVVQFIMNLSDTVPEKIKFNLYFYI